MQIQKIGIVSLNQNNSVNKTNFCKTTPTFKSYSSTMSSAVKRDLKDVTQVSSTFKELLDALKSTSGVRRNPLLTTLENNGLGYNLAGFMETITAPIAKVPSKLRDLVFKAEEEGINLLEKDGVGSLTMYNFGKKGFLNSIFNSQDARSDIKFVFSSPNYDSFEIGITKRGGLQVEQDNYPYWVKSEFGIVSRSSKKSGEFDTTPPIW